MKTIVRPRLGHTMRTYFGSQITFLKIPKLYNYIYTLEIVSFDWFLSNLVQEFIIAWTSLLSKRVQWYLPPFPVVGFCIWSFWYGRAQSYNNCNPIYNFKTYSVLYLYIKISSGWLLNVSLLRLHIVSFVGYILIKLFSSYRMEFGFTHVSALREISFNLSWLFYSLFTVGDEWLNDMN